MPIHQFFIDPSTGGTFPETYSRIGDVQWDRSSNRVSVQVSRWVGAANYSLGQNPLLRQEFSLVGSQFVGNFAPVLLAAEASFRSSFVNAAEAFIMARPEFSGAIQVP